MNYSSCCIIFSQYQVTTTANNKEEEEEEEEQWVFPSQGRLLPRDLQTQQRNQHSYKLQRQSLKDTIAQPHSSWSPTLQRPISISRTTRAWPGSTLETCTSTIVSWRRRTTIWCVPRSWNTRDRSLAAIGEYWWTGWLRCTSSIVSCRRPCCSPWTYWTDICRYDSLTCTHTTCHQDPS